MIRLFLAGKALVCIPAQPVPIPACYICYQEARVNPKGIHRTGSGNLPCGPSFHLRLLCDWPMLALASFFSSAPVSGLLLSNPSSILQALMQIFALWRWYCLIRSHYNSPTPKSQSDTRIILSLAPIHNLPNTGIGIHFCLPGDILI